jgi:hypothetical protein
MSLGEGVIAMKLMTSKLEKRFAEVGEQDTSDPVVIAKFFNPAGAGTWWATAYYPDDRQFFGYVSIFGDHNDEWGYFSLEELESYISPYGTGIERDRNWTEKRFSKIQR